MPVAVQALVLVVPMAPPVSAWAVMVDEMVVAQSLTVPLSEQALEKPFVAHAAEKVVAVLKASL